MQNCNGYFETAEAIAAIKHPVGSKEWLYEAATCVKRYGHCEKRDLWHIFKLNFLGQFKNEAWSIDSIEEFVDLKLQTHSDLAKTEILIDGKETK